MKRKFIGTHEEYLELQKSYISKSKGRTGKPCTPKIVFAHQRAGMDYMLFKSRFWRYRRYVDQSKKAVLLGARLGTEVRALRDLGHRNCIGMDVQVEYANDPTLVEYGDFMDLKYEDNSVQFAYTNCLDHLLEPSDFINGLERVMMHNAFVLLDIDTQHRSGRGFSGWDMYEPDSVDELLECFAGDNRHIVSIEESLQPFEGGGVSVMMKFGEMPNEYEKEWSNIAKSYMVEKQKFERADIRNAALFGEASLGDKLNRGDNLT